MNNLLGVVLCGGESRRMGSDKGLLRLSSKTWSELTEATLVELNITAVLSINQSQLVNYSKIFDPEKLILDNVEIPGPLRGILSVHKKFPQNDLLLLGCDMINMRPQTLQSLIEKYQTEKDFDYYVYQHGSFAETLGSIYTSKGLNDVLEKSETGKLHGFSLQSILNNGNTLRLNPASIDDFKNLNTRF